MIKPIIIDALLVGAIVATSFGLAHAITRSNRADRDMRQNLERMKAINHALSDIAHKGNKAARGER